YFNDPPIEVNLIQNDYFPIHANWDIELSSLPVHGTLTNINSGIYEYAPEAEFTGTVTFEYELCSVDCPELCTSATVRIKIEKPEFNDEIPNAITPNDDGVNDTFVFPQLELNP